MKHLLGTAAIAAMLGASPALAQQDYYNTNPTPAERAQTEDLNARAAAAAQGGGQQAQSDADAARYDARKAQYDAQKADADARNAVYARDRAHYEADRDDYGHRWDAFFGHRDFRDLSGMNTADLVGRRVDARGGAFIGRVRAVDADRFGHVRRVSVSTGVGRRAWLDAADLRYDPATGTVHTYLRHSDVDAMARMRFPH